jgi:NAD+ kinase
VALDSRFDGRPFVGVLPHPLRDITAAFALLSEWAARSGRRAIDLSRSDAPPVDECGIVVALGGDGTVLRALALAASFGVPVLGVNFGRLGFLAEVDASQLGDALTLIDNDSYTLENRPSLRADGVRSDGRSALSASGYNDVVLTRTPGHGQAALAVHVQRTLFARYSADALIVSTSMGSTAYNFAAGGPLIAPQVDAFSITPVSPHGLFRHSLIADASHRVEIEVLPPSAPIEVEIDGRARLSLTAGDGLVVQRGPHPAVLLRVSPRTFYERARNRLGLVDPPTLDAERLRERTQLSALLDAISGETS